MACKIQRKVKERFRKDFDGSQKVRQTKGRGGGREAKEMEEASERKKIKGEGNKRGKAKKRNKQNMGKTRGNNTTKIERGKTTRK